jgi:hydroxylaminobenzene mutase
LDEQRRLFRHGFTILVIAFALGGVAGAAGGGPHARLWLGAHTTGILVGLLVVAVGAVWPTLVLGARASRTLYGVTLGGNWVGVVVLGIFAPAVGFPSAISTPELPPAAAWAAMLVGLGLVVVTVSTFTMCGLVIFGLRGGRRGAS